MRILVAIDGSDQSHQAVQALAHLARAEDVALVHVVDVPVPAYPMMMPEVSDELFLRTKESMEQEGRRVLRQMQAILPLDVGPCQPRLEVGKPSDVLVSMAKDLRIDLMVLGSRGLSPVKELLVGSVSHRVFSQSPCSVLIVNRPLRSLRQVLLAVEGEGDAQRALSFLTANPFRATPEITCLTVLPFSPPPWPAGAVVSQEMERAVLERGAWFVDETAKKIGALGYRVMPKARIGVPSAAILEEADKLKPDLLLLGTRGRQGVTRFVLGSVSHTALHRAPCPVLVFR